MYKIAQKMFKKLKLGLLKLLMVFNKKAQLTQREARDSLGI